jgi:hypothetical protein
MHVVGKYNGSEESKRLLALDESHCIAKALHIGGLREPRPTLVCHEREEIGPAWHEETSVIGHKQSPRQHPVSVVWAPPTNYLQFP